MDISSKEKPNYLTGELVRCNSHENSGSPNLKAGTTYRVYKLYRDGDGEWIAGILDDIGVFGEFYAKRFDPLTMMATTTFPGFKAGDRVRCIDPQGAPTLAMGSIYLATMVWLEFGSWKVKVEGPNGLIRRPMTGEDWWYARRFELASAGSAPIASSTPAINDKTCPHCQNNRCSSTEKSCWKCGGKL